MLVRDIAPPIQRVIQDATEKTVRFYKRLSFWVKTSKYGAVTAAVLTSILAGSLTVVIASDKKTDNFYPTVLEDNSWGNSWNSRTILNEIDLGQNADLSKFDHNNSLFINYIVPEEPEEETPTSTIDLEPTGTTTPESSPTENVVPGESTSSPETTPSEISTTTPTEEPQPPVEEIIPEPQPQEIIPPVEEPVETSPVEEPSVSFFQRFFGSFITNAQDDATTPLVPSEPVEGEPAPEPLVEETPPAETTPDANLPTVDGDVPIVEEPVPDTSTPPQTDATLTPDTPIDPVTETPYPTETAEEPNIVGIFNNSTELVAAKFAHQERIIDGETPIELITLKLSMAMAGVEGEDDAVLIEYRKHETDIWNQLQVITQNQEQSNKTNNDYFSYAIPVDAGENFRSFEELEVRVTHLSNNPYETRLPVFIDAVWFEVEYLDIVTEATFAEPRSNIDTFRLDQEVQFQFEYKDPNGRWFENPFSFIFGSKKQFQLKSHYVNRLGEKDKPKGLETEISYEDESKWTFKVSKPPEDIKPGEYSVDFYTEDDGKIYKQTVKFYWGVLAINTNKSIYAPGDDAVFQMGVLSDIGETICDANLKLTLEFPDKAIITPQVNRSESCGPRTVTNRPDYFAAWPVDQVGTYAMKLESFDASGTIIHATEDTFEVRDEVPFDVERFSPTRIFPLANYTTGLIVKAYEDYSGPITEKVPGSFEILESNYEYTEELVGEERILTWNLDLVEGEEYEITYTFDPPNVSPELHLIGPLLFQNAQNSASDTSPFKEARLWQIASDVTCLGVLAGVTMTDTGSGTCRGYASTTGSATFTIPDDWSSTNKIQVIGGGGGGGSNTTGGSGGGGGGAYASTTNQAGLSGTYTYSIGTGGLAGQNGSNTWFGSSTCAASLVCAGGGFGTTTANVGSNGGIVQVGSGFSGGPGGYGGTGGDDGGGGGGGAGGPSGTGASGNVNDDRSVGGMVNGGAGGGGASGGTTGQGPLGEAGGAGGAGPGGGGAGAAGSPGSDGTDGGGGGGATNAGPASGDNGGDGGPGTEDWTSHTVGAGGGGGAASDAGEGGNGGLYGGGVGGHGEDGDNSAAIKGVGARGVIVITYTPPLV